MRNVIDKLEEMFPDYEILHADGFERAIIGFEPLSGKVIYDIEKMTMICTKFLRWRKNTTLHSHIRKFRRLW